MIRILTTFYDYVHPIMSFDISQDIFKVQAAVIDPEAQVIFVADFFASDLIGGAELTLEALIEVCPYKHAKVRSSELTTMFVKENAQKFWVFGNFTGCKPEALQQVMAESKYVVIECDYKFCKYRSIEKHAAAEGKACDCHNQNYGQFIAAFLLRSSYVFWMSEKQKEIYETRFPTLKENSHSIVLSSVFSAQTIEALKKFRSSVSKDEKWLVFKSSSWIKGTEAALAWCEENKLDYEIVENLPYLQMLQRVAKARGLVYLPPGGDTCPRMIIEAKLLNCLLVLNENVQHSKEEWFNTADLTSIEDYLKKSPEKFWNCVEEAMLRVPKISGYVTAYDCIRQQYPFEACIKSLLNFCFEVCVVDGGSEDGTWERLQELASAEPKIKIKQIVRDWNSPRFSVFDGAQKAEARAMCEGEYCWQADSDEVFHPDDVKKIYFLCSVTHADIIALPVVEYWGSTDKVRIDVTPWKWRLSKNKAHITHGIPRELRRYDAQGNLFSAPGSDGCDLIHNQTHERLNFVSFYSADAENTRRQALTGNPQALVEYEKWLNQIIINIPAAYHFSWCDIERKMKLYRDYWQRHWNNLSATDEGDTAANNMFFDFPWKDVTDEMIKTRAKELAEKTGGHIFHTKWDGRCTPWIKCDKFVNL